VAFGKKNEDVLRQTVVIPAPLTDEQFEVLCKISDVLWLVRKEIIDNRQQVFETHLEPLYTARREAWQKKDKERLAEIREQIKALSAQHMPNLADEINSLTARRAGDKEFAKVPRNWVEQAIIGADAEYKSFMSLRAKGDPHAKPPNVRNGCNFCEIMGRTGFKVKDESLILSPGALGEGVAFVFPLPTGKKNDRQRGYTNYQRSILERQRVKVKSFNLYRDKPDLREEGRFWISISYDIDKPEPIPFVPEEAVYLALGASETEAFCGIISPKGEVVVSLPRPDVHFKAATDILDQKLKACTVGSRQWQRRTKARQKHFSILRGQQKHKQRESVSHDLLEHGAHFVVIDFVVRSKAGRLADRFKPERRGTFELNWRAQNTGLFSRLIAQLEQKAKEHGGSVVRHKLAHELPPEHREDVIPLARQLRDDFLAKHQDREAV